MEVSENNNDNLLNELKSLKESYQIVKEQVNQLEEELNKRPAKV